MKKLLIIMLLSMILLQPVLAIRTTWYEGACSLSDSTWNCGSEYSASCSSTFCKSIGDYCDTTCTARSQATSSSANCVLNPVGGMTATCACDGDKYCYGESGSCTITTNRCDYTCSGSYIDCDNDDTNGCECSPTPSNHCSVNSALGWSDSCSPYSAACRYWHNGLTTGCSEPSCLEIGTSTDCGALTCKKCDTSSGCINQGSTEDYYSQCPALDCDGGATKYYYGWVSSTCYFMLDVSATDAVCNGSGACKSAADQCPSSSQGASTGTTCTVCQTQTGCAYGDTTAGTCPNKASNQYTGCTGTTGCSSDGNGEQVCACNGSGGCSDLCGNNVCDSWESTSTCSYDCDRTAPTYSLNSTNSTSAGTPINFSLKWTDNVGLSKAITSLYNGSAWINASTWCSLSGTTSWCNQTMIVNSTAQTLWWKQYANDTSTYKNWNTSENFSLATIPTITIFNISSSQSFTLNTIAYGIRSVFTSISQSLSISSTTSTILSSIRSITSSFLITDTPSRLRSIINSIFQSLSLNTISNRLLTGLRSISQSLTINSISSSLSNFSRSISGYFTVNTVSSRILSSIRILSDSLAISSTITRTLSSIRFITSYFTLTDTYSRLRSTFSTISQSLSLNIISNRLLTGLRQVSGFFTINAVSTRTSLLFKSITSSFIISTASSRTLLFIRLLSDSVSINSVTSKIFVFFRSITYYFTVNSAITRTQLLIRSISQSIIINTISTRIAFISKTVTNSFTFVDFSIRYLFFSKILFQPISIYSITGKFIEAYRSTTSGLFITTSISRIQDLTKIITSSFSLNALSSRTLTIMKTVANGLAITTIINRTFTISRILTEGISLTGMIFRTQSLFISISQQFSAFITTSGNRISSVVNTRIATLALTMSESTGRMRTIIATIIQPLNISTAFNRLLSLIRTILEVIGIVSAIKPSVACSVLKTESSCAAYSCYWCSGSCQSSTCPIPSGGGGGGGWIEPTRNVTNITKEEVVLDIEIHVENKQVIPGDKIYATISLLKLGGFKVITDLNVTYWIEGSNGSIIGLKKEMIGIETARRDIYFLIIPAGTSLGAYNFKALVQYDNVSSLASDSFDVVSKLPEFPISISNINVPKIFVNSSFDVNLTLKNKAIEKLQINVTLLFPRTFEPVIVIKNLTLEPLTTYDLVFRSIAHESGNFTVFIKIDHEGKKMIRDFSIEVYSPKEFYIYYFGILATIVVILIFIYYNKKIRHKIHEKALVYVYKKDDAT